MRLCVLLAIFLTFVPQVLLADVPIPPLSGPVVDQTGVLGPHRRSIEQKLIALKTERGSEVGVLVVSSTLPESIEQYSIRVVEAWKLGRSKIDDGALLIVALSDRAVRIEVGRGLEGDIPDLVAHRIIQEQIIPRFREGNIAEGIEAGVDAIVARTRGAELPAPYKRGGSAKGDLTWVVFLLFTMFIVGSAAAVVFGSLVGSVGTGVVTFALTSFFAPLSLALGLGGLVWFLVLFREPLLYALGNSRSYRSGGWGGGGGWSSGGGFGSGGSFGGGGASGRW